MEKERPETSNLACIFVGTCQSGLQFCGANSCGSGSGVFNFRAPTSRRHVFVTFMDRAILFSSYKGTLPWSYSNTYEGWYGSGAEMMAEGRNLSFHSSFSVTGT